jgi:tRNA(Ile)-lysidine synthetase-like protein
MLHRAGRLRSAPVVFHLDHGLRPDAHLDAELVRAESESFSLPFYGLKRNCAGIAERIHRGVEETGRRLRYRHLRRLIRQTKGGTAVTAHHADDYAESLLLHLIRGGGAASFATLDRHSILEGVPVFRPFVTLDRQMIERFASDLGVPYREDSSNRSADYTRNRIRSRILPELKKENLNTVNLWKNFHEIIDVSTLRGSEIHHPVRILLDRELFTGAHTVIKTSLDAAMQRLGLPPVTRGVIEELTRQRARHRGRFRLITERAVIHSQEIGPIWIVPNDSPLLKPFNVLSREAAEGRERIRIAYGGVVREYRIASGTIVSSRKSGMRLMIRDGAKSLKKIFQEARLPPEIREQIPLLFDPGSGLVVRICFSFLDGMRDLIEYGERNDF